MNDFFDEKLKEYGITPLPYNTVPGMAYIPFQGMNSAMYSPEQGIEAGTLFPVLNKPFCAAGGK